MIAPTRRLFLAGAGLTAASTFYIPKGARAAEFTYKFANNLPPSHPLNLRAREAVDKIKDETNGRLVIEIFPSAQLGSDTDLLSQLRAGGVEFFTLAGAILSTLVPVATIEGIPYAFPNYDAVWKAMDGDLGALIRQEITKFNILAMDKVWDNGFHQITTRSKAINTPADLKGLKIRTGPSPLQVSMCNAFGASPTSLNFNELYTALQTGVVDAQLNALVIIQSAKLYEVQKFCAITNHMWSGFWFLANRRAWERLPTDLRDIAAKHLNAAGVAERADVAAGDKSFQDQLTAHGMTFTKPDPAQFRAILAESGFYRDWQTKLGEKAWATLEASVGKLG